MDTSVLRRAGIEDADAVVVATDGDNTNIVVGQVVQKRFGIDCVVVRLLDPARAEFYEQQGMRTICPTSNAIERLTEAVRACDVPQPGKIGGCGCTSGSQAGGRSARTSRAACCASVTR